MPNARTPKPRRPARPPSKNPLISRWATPFEIAPFDKIKTQHFRPALEAAFRAHNAEIKAIAANPAKPTFANTIVAIEKSGRLLNRVSAVFGNLEATEFDAGLAGNRPRDVAALCGARNAHSARCQTFQAR